LLISIRSAHSHYYLSHMKNPVHNDQRLKEELCKFLSGFVLERRLELFNQILSLRTRYITVVLEDVYQEQNASAVIRTCD